MRSRMFQAKPCQVDLSKLFSETSCSLPCVQRFSVEVNSNPAMWLDSSETLAELVPRLLGALRLPPGSLLTAGPSSSVHA